VTGCARATTEARDLVIDPAAGSFTVLRAAHQLGREFIGCDLTYKSEIIAATPFAPSKISDSVAHNEVKHDRN
jgi:DNA methylase